MLINYQSENGLRKCIIAFFPLLLFFSPSLAVAEVKGGLAIREEYNDNVLLTPKDKESDWSTVIEPTLESLWSHKKGHSLKLNYNSNLLFYHENTEENTFRHVVEGEGELLLPAKSILSLRVRDEYDFFQRDIREAEAARNQAEGNDLNIRPALRLEPFEPVYFEAGYRYQRRDYRDSDDGVEWRGEGPDFSLGVKLMPELEVALIYQHLDKDFTFNPSFLTGYENYKDNMAGLRLKSEVSDRLAGGITYSRLWREYESGEDFEGDNWEGELTLQLLDETSLELNYSQSFLEQVEGELYERREGGIMVTQFLGKRGELRYGVFSYRESYLDTNRIDEAWGGRGSLSTPFFTRFILSLRGGYERQTFRGGDEIPVSEERKADYYTVEAEVAYNIRDWFSAFLRYARVDNNAEGDISEYRSNRYAIGLSLLYD